MKEDSKEGRQNNFEIYMQTMEIMRQGAMWLNDRGKIIGVTEVFAENLGYEKKDFSPSTIFEVNPYLNFLSWKKNWESLLLEKNIDLESEYIKADGELCQMKMRGICQEVNGETVCCVLIENSSGANQSNHWDLLKFVSDFAEVGVWEMDLLQNKISLTPNVLPLLGIKKQSLSRIKEFTEKIKQAFLKRDGQAFIENLEEIVEEGGEFELDLSLKGSKDKHSNLDCKVFAKAILNGKEPVKIIGGIQSKTNKESHQNNEPSEIFRFCIEKSGDMVFWVDVDANILYLNEEAIKTLGYSKKEISKLVVFDIAPQRNDQNWDEIFERLRNDKFVKYESLLRRKDGKILPVEVALNYLMIDKKEMLCAFLRDITKRKREQTKLEIAYEEIQRLKEMAETENILLKEEMDVEQGFSNIISKSENYKRILKQVEQVADTNATVLILGETGTGKELLARAIHQLSERADLPMVKVNCGALPANLIESELFGHEKGAFTGAFQQKKGRFEIANKSTIFLDEMGELPLDLQAKLLRVLQEGEFQRVGGNATIKVNVRVIAATNRNLEKQVEEGKFREDLYYRLNVFPIQNIPLRERRDDIIPLVKHFVTKFSEKMNKRILEIPPDLIDRLMRYEFPGNVRELENMIERAMILSKGSKLELDSLLFKKATTKEKSGVFKSLEEMQRGHIIKALKQTNGRVSGEKGAANLLRINDKTLVSRMKKLNILKKDYL